MTDRNILLVGNPNVGKSALFMALSGQYVEVSNFSGTTVELLQTTLKDGTHLMDTPGVYSISALNDEERITKQALENLTPSDLVINVVNATCLQRDLFLTLHLIDLGLPFLMVVNQIDQAAKQNLNLDLSKLRDLLKVPVFGVSALTGEGLEHLKTALKNNSQTSVGLQSPEIIGEIAATIKPKDEVLAKHQLLLLEEDTDLLTKYPQVKIKKGNRQKIYAKRRERVDRLLEQIKQIPQAQNKWVQKLDSVLIHPLYGSVLALLTCFFFLYQVLGVWVAGDLVDFLENQVFEKYWNQNVRLAVAQVFPVEIEAGGQIYSFKKGLLASKKPNRQFLQNPELKYVFSPADLTQQNPRQTNLQQDFWSSIGTILAGPYGILTLTVTYLLGLLLPLIYFFYLSWALLEDSGYLPRLAVLADGFMRQIGLNGRGVIPLVLGFGCVTMAMVTTRLMKNKREQLILMILLSLAIPCSAQLGIIQGLLAKVGGLSGWLIWLIVLFVVFCICGFLANKLIPGVSSPLLLDLPPLRLPQAKNVFRKAGQKSWFFLKESAVAFFWAALVVALCQVTGILNLIIASLEPLVSGILHLPKEVALSFLLGMVRRDFGAFGLLELSLTQVQAITACVSLTLFVPCIATLGVMIKERDLKTAIAIWLCSWFVGFAVGGLLTRILELF